MEEYLRIQTRRFGNRIRYIRNCRVEPETIRIPCFTLQPFVENALLYGLEPKKKEGVADQNQPYKDRVRIRILDTGLGMDEQVLAGLKVRDSVPMGIEQGRSIGIKNVMARLRIFFDAQEDFRMYSKPGRGTLVWISFPPGGNGHVQSPDCR